MRYRVGVIDSITEEDSDTGLKPKVRTAVPSSEPKVSTDVSPLHPFPQPTPCGYRAWYPY